MAGPRGRKILGLIITKMHDQRTSDERGTTQKGLPRARNNRAITKLPENADKGTLRRVCT